MKRFTRFFAVMALSLSAALSFAQLPYNTTMTQTHYRDSKTKIATSGTNAWDNGIRCGSANVWSGATNWDDKYAIIALDPNSVAYQLHFKFKCNVSISSNPDWYVAESPNNSDWTTIWTNSNNADSWSAEQVVELSKSTKYLKFCFSGNYGGTFGSIMVTDQRYVNDPSESTIDFGANTISSGKQTKSFDIEWCNVAELSVVSSDPAHFEVSPSSFAAIAKYGTQTITVSYNRNVDINVHSANITIGAGTAYEKTVALTGSTTIRPQAIHWNAELETNAFTLNPEEALSISQIATADNEDAVITLSSDNQDVVAIAPDGLSLYAVAPGTANITVSATGNDIYAAGEATKTFVVTNLRKQTITWDQVLLGLKTTDEPVSLTATASSGGVVTYAIVGESDVITLSGENNATLSVTGLPGEAYIVATQAGGVIGEQEWVSASFTKLVKVRDPNAACDEYALADQSFKFANGMKAQMSVKEYALVGQPTALTFTAQRGAGRYAWSEIQPMYVEQFSFENGAWDWHSLTSVTLTTDMVNYGPYNLDESATKIRFRSGEFAEQTVSSISIPRAKFLTSDVESIVENAERNVLWSKTITVKRSNIDVVDLSVEAPFVLNKSSIGADCADINEESFVISLTPTEKGKVYEGTVVITDGKTVPTTLAIPVSVTAVAFNQAITWNLDQLEYSVLDAPITLSATTDAKDLEVSFSLREEDAPYASLSEDNVLTFLHAGTIQVTAYQEGNDRYNAAEPVVKTIVITAPAAYSTYEATLCQGDSIEFNNAWYKTAGTFENILLSEKNVLGGDSLVTITVTSLPTYTVSDEPLTIYVGADKTWHAQLLNTYAVGEYTLYDSLQTVNGCDSIITLALTVAEIPAVYSTYEATLCQGDSIEFNNAWYKTAGTFENILLSEKNVLGGDSLVTLTVNVIPMQEIEFTLDSLNYELQPVTIDTIALSAVAETEVSYTSSNTDVADVIQLEDDSYALLVYGAGETTITATAAAQEPCAAAVQSYDLVVTLAKDDQDNPTTSLSNTNVAPSAVKILRDGSLYILRDSHLYDLRGQLIR